MLEPLLNQSHLGSGVRMLVLWGKWMLDHRSVTGLIDRMGANLLSASFACRPWHATPSLLCASLRIPSSFIYRPQFEGTACVSTYLQTLLAGSGTRRPHCCVSPLALARSALNRSELARIDMDNELRSLKSELVTITARVVAHQDQARVGSGKGKAPYVGRQALHQDQARGESRYCTNQAKCNVHFAEGEYVISRWGLVVCAQQPDNAQGHVLRAAMHVVSCGRLIKQQG
eukprot:1161685-Pelagomonas_calceolata.AAC.1